MSENGTAISAAQHGRRYDIDALRVFAFSLLILYHVAMFYVAEWGWHVKSEHQSELLQIPMMFTNQWRMSLLFVVSGLAMSFVWKKYSPGRLAVRRVWRLFLPLLFGMAFIVSPQAYYEAVTKGLIEPDFLTFMGQYLTFQDFPDGAWEGEQYVTWTWNHLWYLPYVLFYTLLLIPIAIFLDGPGKRIREGFRKLRGVWIVIVPILPLMLYANVIFPSFPYFSHAFVDDWYAHAMYGTFFLYGFLIGRDEGFWAELARLRWALLGMSVIAYGLYSLQREVFNEDMGPVLEQLRSIVIYTNRWGWIVTCFAWGHHLLNRPMRWLPYATQAVYPWYILHQTITVVAGYQLAKLSLGPVVEPLLVLTITIGGCFVLYEYVIRRVGVLRPLFGVSYSPKPAGPPPKVSGQPEDDTEGSLSVRS
ncbi:MAG: acyltransferase family protein [Woeseiaceae bacterium]|nr:acyltransferase family protein [Woeseiaceae bacterium]